MHKALSQCFLYQRLSPDERRTLRLKIQESGMPTTQIDIAHIIPRSVSQNAKDDRRNLMFLNRYSHSNLDSYKHPITGEKITRQERVEWIRKINGKEKLEGLQSNYPQFYGVYF